MRLRWIDGLKGLASLMIFFHHFILAFVPALYYGTRVQSNLFEYESMLAESPFMFFVGGHFLVSLFLVLSGLVLSLQVYRTETINNLLINVVKRYLRLALPVFIVSLIVYLLLKFGLFYNVYLSEITGSPWLHLYYKEPLGLKSVFETSFYTVWFIGNDAYSTAFWMLTHLFYGSLLTYASVFLVRKLAKNIQMVIILSIIVLAILNDSYLINFGFGMLLAWMIIHIKLKNTKYLGIILLIISMIFAGYPQGVAPSNFYKTLFYFETYSISTILIHSKGALFLVSALLFLNSENSFLTSKGTQTLGKLSFSIYLLHIPILFSFSSILAITLDKIKIPFVYNMLINLILTLLLTLLTSMLFNNWVIQKLNCLIIQSLKKTLTRVSFPIHNQNKDPNQSLPN